MVADAAVCRWCGAPIQGLVKGACPHCGTVIDEQQAAGLVVDARGDTWRVVLLDAGRRPKKVAKALAGCTPRDQAGARLVVEAVRPDAPQVVVDHIAGSAAFDIVRALAEVGATVRSEFRQGNGWAPGMSTEGWG